MNANSMTRERLVTGTFVLLLLVLWAGFLVHRAPRFPGSLTGSVLAISGAVLMVVVSLAYTAVKRIPALRAAVGRRVKLGTLLTWHVHTGAVGAILAILHTGHRFESNLGMTLTASMLLVSFSGYFGRHLLSRVSLDLREKREHLTRLQDAYNAAIGDLATAPVPASSAPANTEPLNRLRTLAGLVGPGNGTEAASLRAAGLADAIAEMEHSITSHDRLKRMSSTWLTLHIAAAIIFYALLALHIWSAIHFGLRWLP